MLKLTIVLALYAVGIAAAFLAGYRYGGRKGYLEGLSDGRKPRRTRHA